jgi:hypothetical protein
MFPFLVREGSGFDPYIIVGYDLGREEVIYLKDKSETEVNEILRGVVAKGAELPKSKSVMKWDDIRPEERKWKKPNHFMQLMNTSTSIRPERLIFGPTENDTYTGPSNLDTLDADMEKAGLQ